MGAWAIVLAAGSGTRFGTPKQFSILRGARVVDRAIAAAQRNSDRVIVVLPPGVAWDGDPLDGIAVGGPTRAESLRAGLALVPADAEIVLVHDAARPLAGDALWRAVAKELEQGADAVVPGLPVTDTLKRVAGDRITGTVDRAALITVQTPQGFRATALRRAHAAGGDATDDAAFIEAGGGRVTWIPGERTNIKLTEPEDLAVAEAILDRLEPA